MADRASNRVGILLASSFQPHRLRRRPANLSAAAANLSFPSLSSSSPSVLQIEVQILYNRDSKSLICNLCGPPSDRFSATSRETRENGEDNRFTYDSLFRYKKQNLEQNSLFCKTRNMGASVCH
ncbi:hypothetical protein AAC387_Pa10g0396 [Persea americana]